MTAVDAPMPPVTIRDLVELLKALPPDTVIRVTGDATIATVVTVLPCYGCSRPEVHLR
jgi:hypothetical protein